MRKCPLALAKVYTLIEPGPVLLLSTAHQGRQNVMTLSWHAMLDFAPPLIGCVVSNRGLSHIALRATRQCVLNIPTEALAVQVVGCGNSSGRSVDKFAEWGLTALPATEVLAPLIAECFANLECRVTDTRMVNRYGLFVLEVVKAWHDPACVTPDTLHHQGYGQFRVAGQTLKLASKMR